MRNIISYVAFEGYYELDDKLIFSNCCFNGMMEVSKKTGEIAVIKKFPVGPVFSQLLHHKIIRFKNELIFVPNFSYGIHIYDIETKNIEYILIKKEEWEKYRCADSIVYNNKLWLIMTYAENGIISMDLNTHEIIYWEKAYAPIEKILKMKDDAIFWSELYKKDNILYGIIDHTGYVAYINLDFPNVTLIEINKEKQFADITVDGQIIYLSQYFNSNIGRYDLDKKTYKEISVIMLNYDSNTLCYSNLISCNGVVLAISNYSNQIFQIADNYVSVYGNMPGNFEDLKEGFRTYWKRFYSTNIIDNRIIELYPGRSNMLLRIDLGSAAISGDCYQMSDEWINHTYKKDYLIEYIKECNDDGNLAYEWDGMELEDFIDILLGK